MNERRATSLMRPEAWGNEKRYFIWLKGWLRAAAEAQIVVEDCLPKSGVLFKRELMQEECYASLDGLKAIYPCPVAKEEDNAKG